MNNYQFVPPKPSRFSSAHHVIQEARDNYCWIFNKSSLKWWTPDEFYDAFHNADFNSIPFMRFLEDISIRDPRSGISAAFKQVDQLEEKHQKEKHDLIDRIEAFNKKVITYYQEMAKPRLRK